MHIKLGLLGFGNVLRAFADLLLEKAPVIKQEYDLDFSVVGIATQSKGIAINPAGLDLRAALAASHLSELHVGAPVADSLEFARVCPAEMILEATLMNPRTGQPALDFVRTALESGKHIVTANKGPVAFGYKELQAIAQAKNIGFFCESTVMDGVPIHSLKRENLLVVDIQRIRGVLNSTTNFILNRLEEGMSFEEAVKGAQAIGVAEADPSNDIDGWDASIKIAILANIYMGADLRPVDVDRTSIRGITAEQVQAARQNGRAIKLVCEAVRENGQVKASVKPMEVEANSPLGQLNDTASAVRFETDVLEHLTLVEGPAGPRTTAYGMLVDAINIARGRYMKVLR